MSSAKKPLGELLIRDKKIDIAQLEEAKKQQSQYGGRLSSALVRLGYINDAELARILGEQHSVPTVDLEGFEIGQDALTSMPKETCEKYLALPVSRVGNTLVVAFSDPSNMHVRDDLSILTRCKIEVIVAPELSIQKAIEKYYGKNTDEEMTSVVSSFESSEESLDFKASLEAQLLDGTDEKDVGPMVQFVNLMLSEAIRLKASDIHVEPYEKRLRVRFRIDGLLHEKVSPPQNVAAALASRIKIMAKLDIAERRRPQDGRIKVRTANGMDVDFRVSVLPLQYGEKIVMRLLDKSNLKLDMTQLGFEQKELELFQYKINEPQGLVLVTGPTGSGKTTTLYSAISAVNDPQYNISTAEDPVEFSLDGINQVQVKPDIGFTFAEALRSFLRQDPDVILVGEIRDLETAEVAFKAASTGHLVLSTLHTNDAPGTISRLLDMGIPGYLVTSTVTLIVAQRLIGRICVKCKIPVNIDSKVIMNLGMSEADATSFQPYKGDGCTFCNGSGLKGRVAVYELMTITDTLREAILKQATPVEIKQAALRGGMKSLRQAAIEKFKAGVTTLEQVMNLTVRDEEA